jgi:hypothetical protein
LRQLLDYEPETGLLFWKARTPEHFVDGHFSAEKLCQIWNRNHAGKEAFTTTASHGYKNGRIFGVLLYAHRVIWAIVHGDWPKQVIDHLDRDRANNRIGNLRDVSKSENSLNATRAFSQNGGGVHWRKDKKRWRARIMVLGKEVNLGSFHDKESAIAARKEAEAKYFQGPSA